jgi:hypothetical protein
MYYLKAFIYLHVTLWCIWNLLWCIIYNVGPILFFPERYP